MGSGGSGKTTLRKQMRNVYGKPFSKPELEDMKPIIVGNIVIGVQAILAACNQSFGQKLEDPKSIEAAEFCAILEREGEFTDEMVGHFRQLWNDPNFTATRAQHHQFQLQECVEGFMESLLKGWPNNWGGKDWVPTIDEFIRARIRTSGIVKDEFLVDGVQYELYDAGGQRAERRKWIHAFDNVTAVVFVASLTDFEESLYENHSENRLKDSLELFSELVNSKHFAKCNFLVYLNKRDLFEEAFVVQKRKLNSSGLFPDAPDTEDPEEAIDWIKSKFKDIVADSTGDVKGYYKVTTATDKANVKSVFDATRAIIIAARTANLGFM